MRVPRDDLGLGRTLAVYAIAVVLLALGAVASAALGGPTYLTTSLLATTWAAVSFVLALIVVAALRD